MRKLIEDLETRLRDKHGLAEASDKDMRGRLEKLRDRAFREPETFMISVADRADKGEFGSKSKYVSEQMDKAIDALAQVRKYLGFAMRGLK